MNKGAFRKKPDQFKKLTLFGALCFFAATIIVTAAAFSKTDAPATSADRHKAIGVSCDACHGAGTRNTVEMKQCFQCHGSYAKVAEKTKDLKPNPHDSHAVDLECNLCHVGHKPFENYCGTCHKDMKIGRETKKP